MVFQISIAPPSSGTSSYSLVPRRASSSSPSSSSSSPPSPPSFFDKIKWIVVAILFVVIVILEVVGGKGLLFAAFILGAFGFLHLFAGSLLAKVILGGIPLLLAFVSLPEIVGGKGFGDFVGSIPLLGYITPNNWPGWLFRYLFLVLVLAYYHYFLSKRNLIMAYGRMGARAGSALGKGASYAWKNFSLGRIISWILIVGVIYGLDNYSSTLGFDLGKDYNLGPIIVSISLLILGIIFVSRATFFSILVGGVSILLGLSGIGSLIHLSFIETIFKDALMQNFVPGEKHFYRYVLIAILVFYFLFRGKSWAQQEVI